MDKTKNDLLLNDAVFLAQKWQDKANEIITSAEKKHQDQMARLLDYPFDKVITTMMLDQSFRSDNYFRVADQINWIIRKYGMPEYFSGLEKFLMRFFLGIGRHFPNISVPLMIDKMRQNAGRAIIVGSQNILDKHLEKKKNEGVIVNINHLGEAVLGEKEAQLRLNSYIKDLKNPAIEYISVKISTIYSQVHPLAFDHTVNVLHERLSKLYSVASNNFFIRKDKTKVPKFINLDMEEYKDVYITCEAFRKTLDKKEFNNFYAGIVLQSYLPDSFAIQQDLTKWAVSRLKSGKSPIKIRLVKGANMEMEQVESALCNWPLAMYDNKLDVDANYKRMIEFSMEPENIKAAHIGVASHNLFDLAYSFALAKKNYVIKYLSFEMLEGMADHVCRAISKISKDVLVYIPVTEKEQFTNAIAYLVRRLDENTAKENFLRYSCNLTTDSNQWNFLKNQFIASYKHMHKPKKLSHRIQNRENELCLEKKGTYYEMDFDNEPDTDFSIPTNRIWAEKIKKKWKKTDKNKPFDIPFVIGGKTCCSKKNKIKCFDLSTINNKTDEKLQIASVFFADEKDADRAVLIAKDDPDGWRTKTINKRHKILSDVAKQLRLLRKDLIGAAMANTGKVLAEADVEVSEAVDFAEFYPFSIKAFFNKSNLKLRGKGVGVVISPWNFPIAIPCGGITASLAAGNTVIFKPSSAAAVVAWILCQAFWNAGVSKNVLQFLPCSGSTTGVSRLTNHPDVDFIILTGSTDTGLKILQQRPDVFLAAETGGKNATIVTCMADRDQAIKNVVNSAFSNCGQKCSATSLLILERELFEDKRFKAQLIDAAESYSTGSVWDFKNKMGPLINPPEKNLEKAIKKLNKGESWALKPKKINNNPYMLTPCIKWNVKQGSFCHMTELFGPLLSVMCAENLDHAIKLVNQTGYGLTSGIESLDKREHILWKAKIKAGNLYINRGTTGAIVLRQPFGGIKKSCIGPGRKAGGPNYAAMFMDVEEAGYPSAGAVYSEHFLLTLSQELKQKVDQEKFTQFKEDIKKTICAIKSYIFNMETEFLREKDYFHLRGQDNIFRYLPIGKVIVRLHKKDTLYECLARISAAIISGCKLVLSIPVDLHNSVTDFLSCSTGKKFVYKIPVIRQSDTKLIQMMGDDADCIRYAAPDRVCNKILNKAALTGFYISRDKVKMEGRLELMHYLMEQSICENYHRYGNLGERSYTKKTAFHTLF